MPQDLSADVQTAQAVATHLIHALLPESAHDQMKLTVREHPHAIRIEVEVPEAHRGALIGRGGYVAKQMRHLLGMTKLESQGKTITLDIVDDREHD